MCSALGATAFDAWSPRVPPLQVSAQRAYYVQTVTGGAELSESDAVKLDKCFAVGADYLHASQAELAGRSAKKGSASSKRASGLLKGRNDSMNKRQKAAASGHLGPAFLKAHEQAAEDAALAAREAAESDASDEPMPEADAAPPAASTAAHGTGTEGILARSAGDPRGPWRTSPMRPPPRFVDGRPTHTPGHGPAGGPTPGWLECAWLRRFPLHDDSYLDWVDAGCKPRAAERTPGGSLHPPDCSCGRLGCPCPLVIDV